MRKLLVLLLIACAPTACNLSPGFDFPSAGSGSEDDNDGGPDLNLGDGDSVPNEGSTPPGSECAARAAGGFGGAPATGHAADAMGGACNADLDDER